MPFKQLKLDNQLCFPVYAASRLIIRAYQPHLDQLGITYPQYLVMLVLWEHDALSVNEISSKLILNTNTVTPLLKRMESLGIISRIKSEQDERKVIVQLTQKGLEMKDAAALIPAKLSEGMISDVLCVDDLMLLKDKLYLIIDYLNGNVAKE